jgi:isopropylmalate/homocitrate/citramalate synthase
VIDAGATTINVPDTVGYAVPEEFYVRNIDKGRAVRSLPQRFGMAVANSLAAVRAGARQIECTINGIGERAGNCSLEEAVMAIKTRENVLEVHTGIHTTRLFPTSRLVSQITGMPIPRNKAIVGENAFAHEAGIHHHGMLKHHSTYENRAPNSFFPSRPRSRSIRRSATRDHGAVHLHARADCGIAAHHGAACLPLDSGDTRTALGRDRPAARGQSRTL